MVVLVFLCVASFYAIDARPYALAMFCLTASTWLLLRWLETSRPLDAVLYTITAAVVYAHCILSLGLGAGIVSGVAAVWKGRDGSAARRLVGLGSMHVAIGLLCLALLPELKAFYAARFLGRRYSLGPAFVNSAA